MNTKLSDFKQISKQTKALAKHYFGYKTLDLVIRKIKLLIRQNFGPSSYYINDLKEIENSFPDSAPELYEPSYDSSEESRQWYAASQKLVNLLETIQNDLESKTTLGAQKTDNASESVFIVHGNDYEPVKELKVILKEAGLKPIILHEQPSKGMTIIEKLEEYSNVLFAFIILTPDDSAIGKYEWITYLRHYFKKMDASVDEIKEKLNQLEDKQNATLDQQFNELHKDRARQNVILEFGYFIGRLGRSKVCCLYKGDIELPSDMHGICYLHFNKSIEEVKEAVLEELKAAKIVLS